VISISRYDVIAMPSRAVLFAVILCSAAPVFSIGQTPANKQEEINQHSRLAQQYLHEQRPDLAIPELKDVVALDPENPDAQGNLGVLLFFRDDYAGAVPHLRAATRLQPNLWKIQGLLGLAELRTNDIHTGQQDLEAAFPHLTEEKFKFEAGRALLDSYAATGDLEKAATMASALLTSDPTNTSMLYTAYHLYSDLSDKAMITMALTAPNSAQMHQLMARELARHSDDTAAIANYREALRLDPELSGIHSELGTLLFNSSEENLRALAEGEFKAAIQANPDDEKAHLMLGIIAAKRGDYKAAYDSESRALSLQPDDSDAMLELAKVLVSMHQDDKAQQLLEHAVEIDPTNYVTHYRLAALYRRQGQMEKANAEVAAYKKYKDMTDKLEKIFHDMRVASNQKNADASDVPE